MVLEILLANIFVASASFIAITCFTHPKETEGTIVNHEYSFIDENIPLYMNEKKFIDFVKNKPHTVVESIEIKYKNKYGVTFLETIVFTYFLTIPEFFDKATNLVSSKVNVRLLNTGEIESYEILELNNQLTLNKYSKNFTLKKKSKILLTVYKDRQGKISYECSY